MGVLRYQGKEMKYFCIILIVLLANIAHANYYCTGKIDYFGVDDMLRVGNGFGVHRLCKIDEPKCNAWMSLILTAKVSDKAISIYYEGGSAGGNQSNGICKDIGNWVTPNDAPYHIQLH